ncbi:MAG: hypothetical protein L0H24_04790, partial [Microlunatus sp.]|nr:hypothetical protein [Microlunatus sp.]
GYLRRYHPGLRGGVMRLLFAAGTTGRMLAQTLTGHKEAAARSRSLLVGTVTQRAFVGGHEVARTRFDETAERAR